MAKVANEFKGDWSDIERKYFANGISLNRLYNRLQSMYAREEGEIIQRPLRLFEFGKGDCDDQATAILSFILNKNLASPDKIYICLCGRKDITHVFALAYIHKDLHGFDLLPERQIGIVYKYPVQDFYRLSDVLRGNDLPLTFRNLVSLYGLKIEYIS